MAKLNPKREFANFVAEQLSVLGPIRMRAMFGGYGFYCADAFFALVLKDELYLKADELTRLEFEREGLSPFVYVKQNEEQVLSYYQAPESVFEDSDVMREWGNKALAAAWRAQAKPKSRKTPLGQE